MRFLLFYHSLRSDWNHGNAHFLRGIAWELRARGHDVQVMEPADGWSLRNLLSDHGSAALDAFHRAYPGLQSTPYEPDALPLGRLLRNADVVIAHEWNSPELLRRLPDGRRRGASFLLLFHDTHHRTVSDPSAMAALDLSGFDAVLAFGDVIRRIWQERGWAHRAFTWHEAADTRLFRPRRSAMEGDLVWIGNWGDEERTEELREYLIEPVRKLGLRAAVHGVRYPKEAVRELERAGIAYRGYLPNAHVPSVFGKFRVTVHIPRRPYATTLPGIPTIRPFEALACGIPLVCAPWDDTERLFSPGRDYLVARSGERMTHMLRRVLNEPELAWILANQGRRAVLQRHTCSHRVDELLAICGELTATRQHHTGAAS